MINNNFKESVFLVTGGTGSFGYAFVLKLIEIGVKEIRILSRDEKKQSDMKRILSKHPIKFFVADVRDKSSMYEAFRGVNYVIHAAALKQVPTMENFPLEAIKTNLFGAQNVIESAMENNIKKVIFLSTDKAVEPVNVMGLSKSLMEKLVLSKDFENRKTKFVITRFGNVIGSRGSVIPIMIEKIKSNETLTLTHKKMTRFFISLKDAVDLVILAIIEGDDGDIFIKNTKSLKLTDLIDVISMILNKSAEVKITNHFPGEKIREYLVSEIEVPSVKIKRDILIIPKNRFFDPDVTNNFHSEYRLMNKNEIKEMLLINQEIKDLIE